MRLRPFLTTVLLAALALSGAAGVQNAAAQERRVPTLGELRASYAPVVQRVAPAVVNVYAAKVVQQRNPLFEDPILDRLRKHKIVSISIDHIKSQGHFIIQGIP